jgi:hypothetical protein
MVGSNRLEPSTSFVSTYRVHKHNNLDRIEHLSTSVIPVSQVDTTGTTGNLHRALHRKALNVGGAELGRLPQFDGISLRVVQTGEAPNIGIRFRLCNLNTCRS